MQKETVPTKPNRLNRILPCLGFLCMLSNFLCAQEVIFVNKNGGTFIEGTKLQITLQIDKDLPVYLETETGKIDLSRYTVDSLAVMKIKAIMIDGYYNEYLPEQFQKLDTVELFQTNIVGYTTPRFFLNMNYNMDSVIIDEADWFRKFLAENATDSTIRLIINHADKLKRVEKKEIQKIKERFCDGIGIDERTIELVDAQKPYTTSRFNFFNQKTEISRAFVDSQNTEFMRAKAEEYSLVLMVEMVWSSL